MEKTHPNPVQYEMCSMPPAPALHPASLKKIENIYLNYDSFYFKCHMKIQVDYYLFPEAFFTKIN